MTEFEITAVLFAYACGLGVAHLLGRRERALSPEKARRFAALPLRYRLACPLVVVPLATALPLALYGRGFGVLAAITACVVAPLSFSLVEVAAVKWYRSVGLL